LKPSADNKHTRVIEAQPDGKFIDFQVMAIVVLVYYKGLGG
jgi:hypothetical protein